MQNIYLDYNATHPPDTEILKQALDEYLHHFANSSGLSLQSQKTHDLIEKQRSLFAGLLGVKNDRVVFTSSATEANSLVISALKQMLSSQGKIPETAVSLLEHPSVSESVLRSGFKVRLLPVTRGGVIDVDEYIRKAEPADFSIAMLAHNETGVIQPVAELQQAVLSQNKDAVFLCDISQALPKMTAIDNPVDSGLSTGIVAAITGHRGFVTLAGHKIGAGFGCAALILPDHIKPEELQPYMLIAGGAQEQSLRAGTHNTFAIVALVKTLAHRLKNQTLVQQIAQNTRSFENLLKKELPCFQKIIGQESPRLPGTTLALFDSLPIDFALMGLDRAGITVSTGTSCKSRSRQASEALLAMGYTEKQALSVLRFSYGKDFDQQQQQYTVQTLKKLCESLV